MGIKIGDIDIANEIVELHYQSLRTQMILEHIINSNSSLNKPTKDDIEEIDSKAIKNLQNKFPSMGISKK